MSLKGKISKAIFAIALVGTAASATASAAFAAKFEKPGFDVAAATTFGNTLPPMGYVDFCARGEEECKLENPNPSRLALTAESFEQIQQVNRYTNARIKPATDIALYGAPDYWTYAVDAGDCEDYVLLKKRALSQLGFAADSLLVTVVLDEKNEGHAVLTLITDKGDFVLDNRRTEVLRWDQTGYTFLKRQSQQRANQWLSLQNGASSSPAVASTQGK